MDDTNSTNPIVTARKRLGFTQQALADRAHINIRTLRYLEKGLYQNIPSSLLVILVEEFPYIQQQYKDWIISKRREFALPKLAVEDFSTDNKVSPVVQLLGFWDITTTKLCELLCVDRAVIKNSISGFQRTLPSSLCLALEQAGVYTKSELDDLDALAVGFWKRCLENRVEANNAGVPRED